mgnify:CR=1 FL=1
MLPPSKKVLRSDRKPLFLFYSSTLNLGLLAVESRKSLEVGLDFDEVAVPSEGLLLLISLSSLMSASSSGCLLFLATVMLYDMLIFMFLLGG